MRKAAVFAAGIAAAVSMGALSAAAEEKTFWDYQQNKFVTYNIKGLKQRVQEGAFASTGSVSGASTAARRSYTPIPRQTVNYEGPHKPNTIIVNTAERRLYYVFADGQAYKYGIGVGREGFQWSGSDRISRKAEWPGWTPPPQMIKREAAKGRKLPAYMPGGPTNPLGARALYIGSRLYRIHGSNEPWTIGGAVSSGCIRMLNDDVIDLYDKVKVGTKVVVL
jgi:lipoprotein-anchoring transpeptidase ErfK/SrfK